MTVCETIGLMCVMAVMSVINPEAAIGASAGVAFFLCMPFCDSTHRRIIMSVISLFAGYSAGVGVDSTHTMWVSFTSASLGVVTLNTLFITVQDKDGLFSVLSKALDLITRLKK